MSMDLNEMRAMCLEKGLRAYRSIDYDGVLIGHGSVYYGFFSKSMDPEEFRLVVEGLVLESTFS